MKSQRSFFLLSLFTRLSHTIQILLRAKYDGALILIVFRPHASRLSAVSVCIVHNIQRGEWLNGKWKGLLRCSLWEHVLELTADWSSISITNTVQLRQKRLPRKEKDERWWGRKSLVKSLQMIISQSQCTNECISREEEKDWGNFGQLVIRNPNSLKFGCPLLNG